MFGIKIEDFSQNVARLLRRVRYSQKSTAAKIWTTGSAFFRSLKMANKKGQNIAFDILCAEEDCLNTK